MPAQSLTTNDSSEIGLKERSYNSDRAIHDRRLSSRRISLDHISISNFYKHSASSNTDSKERFSYSRRDTFDSIRSDDLIWQPPPGEKPIRVDFRCACFSVGNVNTASLSAQIKFVVVLFWNDERFKDTTLTTNDLPGELWGPDLILENALNSCSSIYDSFALVDSSTGRLKRTITFHGSVRNPMDLKYFPFDEDDLELKFISNCNWRVLDGSRYGNDPVEQTYTLHPVEGSKFFHMGCSKEISEFVIIGWSHNTVIPTEKSSHQLLPMTFTFQFHIIRHSSFYYLKIFFPLWLLVLTSGAAFTMEADDLSGRYEFLTTILLAIIGFLYIIQETIPKIGFLTVIDKVVILSLLSVVGSIFSSYGVFYADKKNLRTQSFNAMGALLNQGIYWLSNIIIVLPAHIRARQHKRNELRIDEDFGEMDENNFDEKPNS